MREVFLTMWTGIETAWNKAVSSPWSPLVFVVAWFQHECSVCTSWRAMFIGAGVALAIAGLLKIGIILVLIVIVLVIFEKVAASMKQ